MKLIARILTAFIPFARARKRARLLLVSWLYSRPVRSKAKSVGPGFRASAPTVVTRSTSIGRFVTSNGLAIHGEGTVSIGDYVQFGPETLILSQNHNYEGRLLPYDWTYSARGVEIGDCVWVGARATILPGAKIGEGAIIQAGAVVHGEIPPCAIAGGNPAKVFAWRDKAHYAELKEKGMFLREVGI